MERENYWIDPKLKEGKHYPRDLKILISFFKNEKAKPFDRELRAVEKTFLDYFLQPFSERGLPLDKKITGRCIRVVNKRLALLRPRLEPNPSLDGWGYKIAMKGEDPKLFTPWVSFAYVIDDGRARNLIHRCPHCKKIFFSKQIKKYHNECRGPYLSKLFSDRYVKSGKAKEKQKRYRQRLKGRQVIPIS